MTRLRATTSVMLAALAISASPATAQTTRLTDVRGVHVAAAMDIPASAIVSAELVQGQLNAGGGTDFQAAVSPSWGLEIAPLQGLTLAALSNGRARTPVMPGYVYPNSGTSFGLGGTLPIEPPTSASCPAGTPRDLLELRIVLTLPPGAGGFSFDHNFMAIDYPEYVCSQFNDGFVALVESPTLGTVNVALDSVGNPTTLNSALFRAGVGTELGSGPIDGTGYETGGATMWNTASVPGFPGETVTLRLFIFDGSDNNFDSLVLLDNFQWLAPATEPPVADAGADIVATSLLNGFASVSLNGTGSTDPEGGALTYSWTGPFGTAMGPTPTVVLPIGVHHVTLTVTDPPGAAASDTVVVTVLDGGVVALATIASHDASIAALQAAVAALQAQVAALQQTVAGMQSHPIWKSVPNAGPKK